LEKLNKILNELSNKNFDEKTDYIFLLNSLIDFIIEKPGEKRYIQVAHTLTNERVIKREFGNLEKVKDFYPKMVISMDDTFIAGNTNGITHILAWDL